MSPLEIQWQLLLAPLADPVRERTQYTAAHSACIELLENLLYLCVLLLDSYQCFLDSLQTLLFVRFIGCARFVFLLAVVLNFLTAIFDLCKAESCRRSFQEMAQRGERCKIAGLAVHDIMIRILSGLGKASMRPLTVHRPSF